MKRFFELLFVKKTSSKNHKTKNLRRCPSIEALEERLVPVVGATQLAAALPNSYTGVVAFDIIQPPSAAYQG